MSKIYLFLGLGSGIVVVLALVTYLGSGGSFVHGIVPELVSFGLEGLVFAGLFSAYEERRKDRELEETRVAARLLLRDAIADIAAWLFGPILKPDEASEPLDLASAETLTSLLETLVTGIERSEAIVDGRQENSERERQFRTFMEGELWTLRALLPVVTPLGNDFLKTWLEMIRHLQAAIDAGPSEERRRSYIRAFLPIQDFAARNYI